MPYEDVPERLLNDELVPVSEIIGYYEIYPKIIIRYWIDMMIFVGVIGEVYADSTRYIKISAFGHDIRRDFVKRIDGDCPDE